MRSIEFIESAAARFLGRLGAAGLEYVDPFAAFSVLDLAPSARAPRGCVGAFDGTRVFVSHRGHEMRVQSIAGHELGHLALLDWGCEPPHNDNAATLAGLAARIPARAADRALRDVGLDPVRLAARWPRMYPSEVFTRIALHVRGWVVFDPLRASHLVALAANDAAPVHVMMRASPLCQAVRRGGGVVRGAGGATAGEYRDPGRRAGVVALVPPIEE